MHGPYSFADIAAFFRALRDAAAYEDHAARIAAAEDLAEAEEQRDEDIAEGKRKYDDSAAETVKSRAKRVAARDEQAKRAIESKIEMVNSRTKALDWISQYGDMIKSSVLDQYKSIVTFAFVTDTICANDAFCSRSSSLNFMTCSS
mgnify:CR=1 FL=1